MHENAKVPKNSRSGPQTCWIDVILCTLDLAHEIWAELTSVCFMLGFWCSCSYRNTARAAHQGLRRFHASTSKTPIMIIFSKNRHIRRDFPTSFLDGCLEKKTKSPCFLEHATGNAIPEPPHCCVKNWQFGNSKPKKHTHTMCLTMPRRQLLIVSIQHSGITTVTFWGMLPHQLDMCSPFLTS